MKNIFLLFLIITTINFSSLSAWEVISKMPIPVYAGEAVVHNSLIYIIGGWSDSLFEALDIVQIYDPESNQWSISNKRLNLGRYGHISGIYDDQLYVFGGGMDSSYLNFAIEKWDFHSEFTVHNFDYNFNRRFSSAVFNYDEVFIFGGYPNYYVTDPDSSLKYLVRYNLLSSLMDTADLFEVNINYEDNFPINEMSVIIDDNIFIFGGYYNGFSNDIYCYNITDTTSTFITTMLEPRAAGQSVNIGNGFIIIIGGRNESNTSLSSYEIFDSNSGSIINEGLDSLQYARTEMMAVLYNDYIYIFGGRYTWDNQSTVKYVERVNVGEFMLPTTIINDNHFIEPLPDRFQLTNFPNPFNPATVIQFNNPKKSTIKLEIFSITGKLIKSIINKQLDIGSYRYNWDGTDNKNSPVSTGIYICKITGNFNSEAKRLLLLR